ncbi:MAG: hypothetical protein CM15mP12_7390 [Gammaproteobacteria bacterium]|nr:MAG: hypothetical protein CM15mP12_7390 [Gammaproteobacteria bacterium]
MPAINLDVSLLHVNTADEKGNTLIYGPDPFLTTYLQEQLSKHLYQLNKLSKQVNLKSRGCSL